MPEFHKYLKDIPAEVTAHGTGSKYVFRRNEDMDSSLTQIAFGKFLPGEVCEEHIHPTMDECFYFISGNGEYSIEDAVVLLKPGTFLIIPAGKKHHLKALGQAPLEFVYWGVALNDV